MVLVLAVMVFPIGSTIYHSFTSWDGTTTRFIGIENFRLLWQDSVLREVLVNSLIFLISVPVILMASLIAAVLVYEQVLWWRLFRVLFFVPAVLSPVVVGALFSTFVLPNGLANEPLRLLGMHPISWLAQAWPARIVVMAALVWTSFGFGMMIILAAMATIDPALYEAAVIDGASWWRRLRSVTVPLVSSSLQFLSVINVILHVDRVVRVRIRDNWRRPRVRHDDHRLLHVCHHVRKWSVRVRVCPGRGPFCDRCPAHGGAIETVPPT